MSYMTSSTTAVPSTIPRASTPLPTLRVSIPIDSVASHANIQSLFTMGHPAPNPQRRYLVNKDTRSKARPGLRKGKWTDEESRYAEQMTYYFKEGLLPLEKGTMLRMYLAEKLNCEPMRITKKFTGDECIGKQIFRPLPPSPTLEQRIHQALADLQVLEKAFLERIEEMSMYCMSTKRLDKPKRSKKPKTDKMDKEDAPDAQAASLLLGFFNQTQDTAESPGHNYQPANEEAPSLSPTPYRSTRKFSISHCVHEYDASLKRPRIDSLSVVASS
ncbi:hypothetical protein AeMF1_011253 [Aphanomyces euteiches]|nr:hypothetical protein AeMF1_011253 [Aphanomyces euteiches]KAH9191390.1 hypothetical protein AeNC1_006634 [Aphanomyces euteiches]